MSAQQSTDNPETLFSLELLVEYIRIEKSCNATVSDDLALGVRLLDFPTLLIYQPEQNEMRRPGEYAFNRGKCCFFKMNLNSLHVHLSNTPLYAMVLDVKEETPKLVGSSLISLAKAMDTIRQEVSERGVSSPSSHREKGAVGVCNLKGEKIGTISLSYKLLCLGASLLPHITERRGLESTSVSGGPQELDCVKEKNKSTESLPRGGVSGDVYLPTTDKSDLSRDIENNRPANAEILSSEDKLDDDAECVAAEHGPTSQTENCFQEDLSAFCPPHLYYSNSAEEKSKAGEGDYKLSNFDSDVFTFEESCSEDEADGKEAGGQRSTVVHQKETHNAEMSNGQETRGVTQNVLGEALQQMPLLNALLVELSQLSGQNPHQSLTVHPSLAWIYRPASTEPSTRSGNKAQNKSQNRQGTSPHLKHLHPPRNCSTPIVRPPSVKEKDQHKVALIRSKSSCKSPRKELVYGTTKTFNLRLKHISSLKLVKHRECMDLIQKETELNMGKGKTQLGNKTLKSSKRKSTYSQSSNLNENIETAMQRVTGESVLQQTVTQKQQRGKVRGKHNREISENRSVSEGDLKFIHIPSVDSESFPQSKDENKLRTESDQSQSGSDRVREKIETWGSSRRSSPKSSFSDSSGEGNEEVDYADDFTSLEPSDAYSPDPVSSPEPSRAKTPKSPVVFDFCTSDSASEGVQRRAAVLPVPVKASSSPQRALRGTHIIRPRTHNSALSFSSDDADRDRSASLQTVCSRKQTRVEQSSGAESFISSRSKRSEPGRNGVAVRGFSTESVSSFEPQEAEELEDELGSLDFKKEYQHISELVANKLPGYTM
ncbi:microtubule-associated protein 10 [Mugil cephalus]|uniref:microtubule-associated protein 10 n=1 Tax=Mugil cephalus TaxID=48193 RepID=UPI001FB61D76|nr:microtubule-associated protein 10 [Mugil cephalus]